MANDLDTIVPKYLLMQLAQTTTQAEQHEHHLLHQTTQEQA